MLDSIVNQLVDVFILCIVKEEPQTGYGVRGVLNRTVGVKMSYGVLYPRLHNLEKLGYITGNWVPHSKIKSMKKKVYTTTDAGRSALAAYMRVLNRAVLALQTGFSKRQTSIPTDIHSEVQPLIKMLEQRGYIVREELRLMGKSGLEHKFDIFALKYCDGVREKVAYGVYISKDEVRVEAVLDLYAKASDVDADRVVMLAIPRLSTKAVDIAKLCRFTVYEAPEIGEAVQRMISGEELVVNA